MHVIGGEKPVKVKPVAPPPEPEVRRGLPDRGMRSRWWIRGSDRFGVFQPHDDLVHLVIVGKQYRETLKSADKLRE
jgi:hypothetical protein